MHVLGTSCSHNHARSDPTGGHGLAWWQRVVLCMSRRVASTQTSIPTHAWGASSGPEGSLNATCRSRRHASGFVPSMRGPFEAGLFKTEEARTRWTPYTTTAIDRPRSRDGSWFSTGLQPMRMYVHRTRERRPMAVLGENCVPECVTAAELMLIRLFLAGTAPIYLHAAAQGKKRGGGGRNIPYNIRSSHP